MKILLVEDDTVMSTALAEMLTANHYMINLAVDGQTGLDLASAVDYDLILLDLQIPKLDGISLCRQLRSQGYEKPILLLTSYTSDAEIVAGLDAGADDYVIKPYTPEALLAKLRALLRRSAAAGTAKTATIASTDRHPTSTLTWGSLCVDLVAGRVAVGEQVIPLTATEYNLLELFLRHPDRIFSRSAILDRLWGFDDAPTERAIVTHVKDVRKKLRAGGLTDDLLETVYGMGYRLKPAPQRAEVTNQPEHTTDHRSPYQTKSRSKNMAAVNRILKRFRDSFQEQIAILEQAKAALLVNEIQPELQQTAKQEAHKLAGSMASFGYPEGSKLARSLEHLLLRDRSLTSEEITQFAQLVTALQQELTQSPQLAVIAPVSILQNYRVLVIDDDTALTERLQAEAASWGIRLKVAPDLTTARARLALSSPDIVLLDLSFPQTQEDGLTLLHELSERLPHLPVIIFTGRDSLADRLAVSRLGARQFLHKPATAEQIFQAIAHTLPSPTISEAKVLIVDDDATSLAALSAVLTPWGLDVITLTEPQRFWQVLVTSAPDLVVLDLEMPLVSGLELCQVVRQDAQWGDLPILVVTAHTDADSLQQAFAAGADDFITKPVLGPELVTRVLSRIERTRSRQEQPS
ncbi:response regulator [Pantanalinema sp. GBBB05]|uniref:response regulator n=1 Tax=Pantanalinema sp. GBBB05 TaxID=2604139 RepID=UPI001DDB0EA4|nr:response regulator [Pantanalinema sp. GBBB05]